MGELPAFPSSETADSQRARLCLIEWEKERRQNAECNHSSTSVQQSDRSTLCKPPGLVIIVWVHRQTVWCQGALQHSQSQFINTRFVSEHIKTWAAISSLTWQQQFHISQSYNLFFYFLLPLDMLMAQNWPCHYDHIKFKLAPNDAEIISEMTRIWLLPRPLSPMATGEKGLCSFTFHCQNKIRIKTSGDNGGPPERIEENRRKRKRGCLCEYENKF